MLKKGLSTNKTVPHFQPFCLYTSRTVLPTQSSHPPPQFKFGPLRQDWNTLPTREWGEKNAFSCFYHQEFIVQTILCLMPLQRLTSVCLELQAIVFFFFHKSKQWFLHWTGQHCPNTPSKHFILFPWWVHIHSFTCVNLNIYLNAVKANISCPSCWKQPFLLLKGPVCGICHSLAVRMNTANK